ncbi:MAG TPA: hypothetical protein VG269_07860 [Tepidisphaeraceae bacterium]|jgi:hypothetical protein|nr:hypothetical protein [Tepidisphaeraceae bacterium]
MTQVEEDTEAGQGEIVARAGRYYRNARYLLVIMMVGAGLWFAYDGWITWPRERAHFDSLSADQQAVQHKPHSDLDILIQKVLAFGLVPLGPVLLAWFLYRSRGEYRLADGVLHVPGNPPVPLTSIRSLDKAKWDRKGIAWVEYDDPSAAGQAKWLVLDDFIYERGPTDKIVGIIEALVTPPEEKGELPEEEVGAEGADHAEAVTGEWDEGSEES